MRFLLSTLGVAVLLSALLFAGCRAVPCTAGEQCNCSGGVCALECIGSGRNCSFRCSPGVTCNIDCPGGGCTTTCEAGSNCSVNCPGGGCETLCNGANECRVDCSGAGCNLTCTGGVRLCKVVNCTNTCDLTCNGAPTCESSCGPDTGCSTQ